MRRIGRWTLNALTALSLLLCVATVVSWVWCSANWAEWTWSSNDTKLCLGATMARDRLLLASYHSSDHAFGPYWGKPGLLRHANADKAAPDLEASPVLSASNRKFKFVGVIYTFRAYSGGGFRFLLLPLWLVTVVLLVLPAFWLWRKCRSRTRPERCQHCNYDLTGNVSGVCPECGASLASVAKEK